MEFIKNNLANILTVTRLLLLPVLIALFYAEDSWGEIAVWGCLIVYIICTLTDFFDGYIARKLNQISDFGTFLDPISDKIFVASILILLVAFERITGIWVVLVIIIFAREFLISGLREFLGPKNIKMPVSLLAKWKTTVQMLSLGFLILGNEYAPYTTELGLALLSLATILTAMTGLSYMNVGIAHLRESKDDL
jgi:cardiolipin synthase